MKREFLKELNLEDKQIEKIMTEYGKSVERMKIASEKNISNLKNEDIISSANPKSAEILKMLINEDEDISIQISNLQKSHPWLFNNDLPVFSAYCNSKNTFHNPFRHGAGL